MERLNDYSNSVRGTRSLHLTHALLLESWRGLWLVTWGRRQWCNVVVWSLSCVRLCKPMDCSPPGSSVHGIFQARYWNLFPFWNTRIHFLLQIFLTQRSNGVSYLSGSLFTTEPPGNPSDTLIGNFSTPSRPHFSCETAIIFHACSESFLVVTESLKFIPTQAPCFLLSDGSVCTVFRHSTYLHCPLFFFPSQQTLPISHNTDTWPWQALGLFLNVVL